MRKTPKTAAAVFFDPIKLTKDFPITRPIFKTPPKLAHIHNCFEIGLCQAGAGIFIIEDKVFSCLAGDAIFINNREFHLLKNATPLNSDWKFINLKPVALLAGWIPPEEKALDISRLSGRGFSNVIQEKYRPDIVFMVRKLLDELAKKEETCRSLVRSLVWTLLILLQQLVPENNRTEEKKPDGIQRIYPALQYLSTHYTDKLDIPKLAGLCHCSLSTFRRTFRRSLGCLPLDYVNDFRLKVTTTMLSATRQSILKIATEAGFQSLSNFNRLFKAKFKQPPRDFRKKHDQNTEYSS